MIKSKSTCNSFALEFSFEKFTDWRRSVDLELDIHPALGSTDENLPFFIGTSRSRTFFDTPRQWKYPNKLLFWSLQGFKKPRDAQIAETMTPPYCYLIYRLTPPQGCGNVVNERFGVLNSADDAKRRFPYLLSCEHRILGSCLLMSNPKWYQCQGSYHSNVKLDLIAELRRKRM